MAMEEKLIAPCGMNCSLCVSYQSLTKDLRSKGFQKGGCAGCIPRGKNCTHMKGHCQLLGNGLIRFCHECAAFPCARLKALDKRYRTRYHMSMIENLEAIRANGIDAFLQSEREKWTCPDCGGVICCHVGLCLDCSLDTLRRNRKFCWNDRGTAVRIDGHGLRPDGDGLRLERPLLADAAEALAMIRSWRAEGGRIHPGLLRLLQDDYPSWLEELARRELPPVEGAGRETAEVPQTLYFLKDADGHLLGAVSLRHYLNGTNRIDGGHVGYGIRPDCRGRGYGNRILALAVRRLHEMGVDSVLVTCDAGNGRSRKVIRRNGGVLENQALDEDGQLVERYWISACAHGTVLDQRQREC